MSNNNNIPVADVNASDAGSERASPKKVHPAFERYGKYVSPSFVRVLDLLGYGRVYVRAEGTRLWDVDGNEYLDMLSGCGACALGYNHPELIAAAEASLRSKVPSFVQVSPGVEAGLLAELLAERLGGSLSRTHLCNSGAEAVEGAMKVAYAATRRAAVLHCERSYHGVTLGALSVMGSERLRGPFPSLPNNEMVPFGDLEGAEKKLKTKRFAAFIVEPIQFEAGVRLAPSNNYFVELSALCKRYGTALIFDEAQTGFGRTGTFFAFQWIGVTPDIVCFAKALSGGLVPIGGYSTSPDWQRRAYGRLEDCDLVASTFGGGALACAVARRTIELIDDALLRHVNEMNDHVSARLGRLVEESPMVAAARGKGLMWAVEFAPPTTGVRSLLTLGIPNVVAKRLFAHWVAQRMLEKGFLTQTPSHDQNVLRVEPALIMNKSEFDRFADALTSTVAENETFTRFARDAGARLVKQLRSSGAS